MEDEIYPLVHTMLQKLYRHGRKEVEMKRLDKKDLKIIASYARIEREINRNKTVTPNIDWDAVKNVLRDSFENSFNNEKIETHTFNSLKTVEEFLIKKKTPMTYLYDREEKENFRYYGIGQNKEGETVKVFFDTIKDNPLVANRPFTIIRYDNDIIDVVHMDSSTIKLTKEQYEIYKELFAD